MEDARTATCRRCSAQLIPPYRFCGTCGEPVLPPALYTPYPAYPPPRKENTLLIVVLIIVLVLVLPTVLAGVLYIMVSGLIGGPSPSSRPTVVLTATKTATGADLIVSISPPTGPGNFRVNLENVTGSVFGTAVALAPAGGTAFVNLGGATYGVTWQSSSGGGLVSTGDHFIVSYPSGAAPATGTTMGFLLIWSDGSTLSSALWQV